MTTKIFIALSVITLALVGGATYQDAQARDYLNIQAQYQQQHPGSNFDLQVQQLFPTYSTAKVGDTFRVERCISCHVPDIGQIGPEQAAQNLAADFFKNDPNATAIAKANNLTGIHPAYISTDSNCVSAGNAPSGSSGSATVANPTPSAGPSPSPGTTAAAINGTGTGSQSSPSATSAAASPGATACSPAVSFAQYGPDGFLNVSAPSGSGGSQPYKEPGYLPAAVDPASNNGKLGIDQVGCIVCHSGSRLSLAVSGNTNPDGTPVYGADRGAHENLIVNPDYSFTEGANLYYKYCVSCHGAGGAGGTGGTAGPPLSNQDRLGFFNEDYYYRCIEYGKTGFEHVGSAMPNWGSIASDFNAADYPKVAANKTRVLSETQIATLVQFIRHWQNYQSVP